MLKTQDFKTSYKKFMKKKQRLLSRSCRNSNGKLKRSKSTVKAKKGTFFPSVKKFSVMDETLNFDDEQV